MFVKKLADEEGNPGSEKAMRSKLEYHLPRFEVDGYDLIHVIRTGSQIADLGATDRLYTLFREELVPKYLVWAFDLNVCDLSSLDPRGLA